MTFPTVVGTPVTSSSTSDATPITVNLQTTNVEAGNIMVVCISVTTAGDPAPTLTTPDGWSLVATQSLPATISTPRAYVFARKIPTAGLGSTVDIDASATLGFAAVAFVLRGTDETPNIVGTWGTGTAIDAPCPTPTATRENCIIIHFLATDAQVITADDPADTLIGNIGIATPGNGTEIWVSYQNQSLPGAAAAATFDNTSDQYAVNTIAWSLSLFPMWNNFQFPKSGNGISVTEKIK